MCICGSTGAIMHVIQCVSASVTAMNTKRELQVADAVLFFVVIFLFILRAETLRLVSIVQPVIDYGCKTLHITELTRLLVLSNQEKRVWPVILYC